MHDPEKQTELLKKMKDSPDGSISVRRPMRMSEERRHVVHQIDLLCEMGMATMKSSSIARITATGYRELGEPAGDYAKQIELLCKMERSSDGTIMVPASINLSTNERHEVHQIELLCDTGLAQMKSDSVAGITAEGYELLNVGEEEDQSG